MRVHERLGGLFVTSCKFAGDQRVDKYNEYEEQEMGEDWRIDCGPLFVGKWSTFCAERCEKALLQNS